MITSVSISNFKQFEKVDFELTQSVVFIGPNNSGKTSLFQALCLWELGARKYIEAKRLGKLNKTNGVTLNRQSLLNTPIPSVKLLWRNQQPVRKCKGEGRSIPNHIPISITLAGIESLGEWKCTIQFLYYNEESFSCRVMEGEQQLFDIFDAYPIHFGFLQTMSGISLMEDKLTEGSIARHLGEGKTAEVIRNLCYNMLHPEIESNGENANERWSQLVTLMKRMFGVTLNKPVYIKETGVIELYYEDDRRQYPISLAGRGFQQILLLLTYILSHPNTVLLLDEPDAHLEIVRQREIFLLVNELAKANGAQILVASHSEVVLNSASASDVNVVALIENKAYPILNHNSVAAIRNALTTYGWDKYAASRMYGHVLFLEGETDLKMLVAFAEKTNHPVKKHLSTANVNFVHGNLANDAVKSFAAFQAFFSELKGLAVFDRIEKMPVNPKLKIISLKKRELENYFARPDVLKRYAVSLAGQQGVPASQLEQWMNESIENYTAPVHLKDVNDIWWNDAKLSDEWLDVIFSDFHSKLPKKYPNKNFKTDYHQLIGFMDSKDVDDEIVSILDEIRAVIEK